MSIVAAAQSDLVLDLRVDGDSPLAASEPVAWALAQTHAAQAEFPVAPDARTITVTVTDPSRADFPTADAGDLAPAVTAGTPEAFAVFWRDEDQAVITGDERGVVHALLEIEDALRCGVSGRDLLEGPSLRRRAEQPANSVRGIMRLFTNEHEDGPWFRDREFWTGYLDELARQRFSQFTFTVGAGYDYLIDKQVDDTTFCFFYPFVLDVDGYDVRVHDLADADRDANLAMLQFIARETVRRGLRFRLGLWNHAYDYAPGREGTSHRILGIDAETHADYTRDALVQLLTAVPEISGLTFRVHYEGGVPEPTHDFWARALERLDEVDTLTEFDFHAKGVDDNLIGTVAQLGKRLSLSPKYWGEHMGPPYHQASIRPREFAVGDGHVNSGTATTSRRNFTRYGYGDFLRADRPYGLVYRVWPGTQRVLSWGDPAMAAGIGREAGFGGSSGVDWFEPLSFKAKKGSGRPGGRELYRDDDLAQGLHDWRKYAYAYRLWGRFTYDPDADPEVWRRALRASFGQAAEPAGDALAHATRILPFLLATHAPSTANNVYWPEMITPVPIVRTDDGAPDWDFETGWAINSDFDMDAPRRFGSVPPLDPLLYGTVDEYVAALVAGIPFVKTSPLDQADRFDALAIGALAALDAAEGAVPDPAAPDWRRWAADVRIMAGIGRFSAHKLRAAVAHGLAQHGATAALAEAVDEYDHAIAAWRDAVEAAAVYRDDLTFGPTDYARGHWADRLPAIIADRDRVAATVAGAADAGIPSSLAEITRRGPAPAHVIDVAETADAGDALTVRVSGAGLDGVAVWHRATDQSRAWSRVDAERTADGGFAVTLPGDATDTGYDLQLIVELVRGPHRWLVPELDADLSNRPYIVVAVTPRTPTTLDAPEEGTRA